MKIKNKNLKIYMTEEKINFTITYNNNRSSNPDSYNKFDEN